MNIPVLLLVLIACGILGGWVSNLFAPISCPHDLYSGWAKLTQVRSVGRHRPFGSNKFIATINCYHSRRYWARVKDDIAVPLDACPADASPASLQSVGEMIRKQCPTLPRFRSGVIRALVKRPDFSLILIPSTHILESIDIEADGRTISVVDRHAFAVLKGDPLYIAPPRLWFAWRQKSPSGSIIFQHVESEGWHHSGPLPVVDQSQLYDIRDVPDRNASLILREFRPKRLRRVWPDTFISLEVSVVTNMQNPTQVQPGEDDTCVICLTKVIPPKDKPQICRHWFHEPCLSQWLTRPGVAQRCPICRAQIRLATGRASRGPGDVDTLNW